MTLPTFLRKSSLVVSNAGTAPTGSTQTDVAMVLNAGETGRVVFATAGTLGDTGTVASIVGGGTWTRKVAYRGFGANGTSSPDIVEVWTTDAGGATATATITVNWTKTHGSSAVILLAEAWSNVTSFGATTTATTTATTAPSKSVTTTVDNTVVAAAFMFDDGGSASPITATVGTLTVNADDGASSGIDVSAASIYNSAASAGNVTTTGSCSSHVVQIVTLELVGDPPPPPGPGPAVPAQQRRG